MPDTERFESRPQGGARDSYPGLAAMDLYLDFGNYQRQRNDPTQYNMLIDDGVIPRLETEGVKSVPEKMPPAPALPAQGVEAQGGTLIERYKNVPTAQEQEGGLLSKLSSQPDPPKCDKPTSSAYEGFDGDFQIKHCGKPTSSTLGIDDLKGDFIPPLPSDPNYNDGSVILDKNGEPESLDFEPKNHRPEYEPPLREKFWLDKPKRTD